MIRVLLALALAAAPAVAAAQAITPRAESPQPPAPVAAPPAAAPGVVPPVTSAPAQPGVVPLTPPAPTLPPRPALPPMSLTGHSEAQVRGKLGEPDVARREAGGALWTYTSEACALMIFFQVQGREGLRVTGASSGPRRRGQAVPELESCITSNRG